MLRQNADFLARFLAALKAALGTQGFARFVDVCLKANHRRLLLWEVQSAVQTSRAAALVCDFCGESFNDMSKKISKGAFNYCSFGCFKESLKREKAK